MQISLASANANIPVLSSAGMIGTQTTIEIKERFATPAWAWHAVANSIDPSVWLSLLSSPLLANLRTLYHIPPARFQTSSGETEFHRRARMVALYMPDVVPSDSTTPHPALGASAAAAPPSVIDTQNLVSPYESHRQHSIERAPNMTRAE